MVETETNISGASTTLTRVNWLTPISGSALPATPQSYRTLQDQNSTAVPRPDSDTSCMEIEAAQRKLQEIEDR